jgi:hypothetical protein
VIRRQHFLALASPVRITPLVKATNSRVAPPQWLRACPRGDAAASGRSCCEAGPREFPELLPCKSPEAGHSVSLLSDPHGRGCGVGRGLGVALGGVGVGVPDGGVAVGVAVGVTLGVGVVVGVAVAVGVGVGEPPPWTAARISTRPQPKTLFGGPASPHWIEERKCAALFIAVRLASIWFCKLGMADHNKAMAPAICGVAMDVPLKKA